jgi:hypothetical protein
MGLRVITAVATLAMAPAFILAADTPGKYIFGGGVGSVDCPRFVSTMDRAKKFGAGSVGYVNETQGFLMYVLGFQTAYNLQTPQTCDIFDTFTSDQLLAWLENYCRAQPLERFSSAVVALAKEVHPRRSQSCKH